MQRIKKVKWPKRNIGGDRAYAKLYYVTGTSITMTTGQSSVTRNIAFNILGVDSSTPLYASTITANFGSAPGLSQLASQFLKYRIRGIKLKYTYYPIDYGLQPLIAYFNAQGNADNILPTETGPTPAFPTPSVSVMPEQRWCVYRVIPNAANGAKPVTLKAYYSVNKVYGPDQVVKNDTQFTGDLISSSPYFSPTDQPSKGPWIQEGMFTMSGQTVAANVTVTILKRATVYIEFFGKRITTQ